MLDKMLTGTGLTPSEPCRHEIDEEKLPKWSKRHGCIYKCVKCGANVYREIQHKPKPGKRVRVSKKERRRKKAEFLRGGDV